MEMFVDPITINLSVCVCVCACVCIIRESSARYRSFLTGVNITTCSRTCFIKTFTQRTIDLTIHQVPRLTGKIEYFFSEKHVNFLYIFNTYAAVFYTFVNILLAFVSLFSIELRLSYSYKWSGFGK